MRVPLTHHDLGRLAEVTGFATEAIGEWLAPEDIDMSGEPETFVALREGRRLLVLRHEGGACRFLVEDRCSIHPHRPLACAAFPFDLAAGPDGLPALTTLGGAPCRIDELPDGERVTACILAMRAELRDYAERVGEWNRRQRRRWRFRRLPEGPERFFAHLALGASGRAHGGDGDGAPGLNPARAAEAGDSADSCASDRR